MLHFPILRALPRRLRAFRRAASRAILYIIGGTVLVLGPLSCVDEDEFNDSPRGNFEALWRTLDEHYCFFPEKERLYGVDWQAVHEKYGSYIQEGMTREQLFDVCARMIRELRDGHVNLTSSFNTARYWDWQEQAPLNFSDSLLRIYLSTDYRLSCGMRYRILSDNIGYVYVPSFDVSIGSGNLSAMFMHLALCNGLIVDVRNNGGGLLTSAQALAESFINEKQTGGYMSHKTGKGHTDFSSPVAIELKPSTGMRWQKPVVVITNSAVYSAANSFVCYMKQLPRVTVIGQKTGGGGGMPFTMALPNGWKVRFSASPMYDKAMQSIEDGILPDHVMNLSDTDFHDGKDTMIEQARRLLTEK